MPTTTGLHARTTRSDEADIQVKQERALSQWPRVFLAVLVFVCFAPSRAHADVPEWLPPATPEGYALGFDADAEAAFTIAVEYWGGPAARCRSTTKIMAPVLFAKDSEGEEEVGVGGMSTIPYLSQPPINCFILLRSGMTFAQDCYVATHEVGHLHGFGHSTDPASIMYPNLGYASVPGCDAAIRARESAVVEAMLVAANRRALGEFIVEQRGRCHHLAQENRVRPGVKTKCWAKLRRMQHRYGAS